MMTQLILCRVKVPDEIYYHWHGEELLGQECITVPFPLLDQVNPENFLVPLHKDTDVYGILKARGLILEEQDITSMEYTEMRQRTKDMITAMNAEPS